MYHAKQIKHLKTKRDSTYFCLTETFFFSPAKTRDDNKRKEKRKEIHLSVQFHQSRASGAVVLSPCCRHAWLWWYRRGRVTLRLLLPTQVTKCRMCNRSAEAIFSSLKKKGMIQVCHEQPTLLCSELKLWPTAVMHFIISSVACEQVLFQLC